MESINILYKQIINEYNREPYYYYYDYLSINDDRVGRRVSFKLYFENNNLKADFRECSRNRNQIITSLEDFKLKWMLFYNDLT